MVAHYKSQLEQGDIQAAYRALVKFVVNLKTRSSANSGDRYSFGSLFQGYMDYTYFYFTNDHFKKRKLKLGLVLNHEKMQFELWLLGQTKKIQEKYWNLLRGTEWIQEEKIPRYSIFACVLAENPDFEMRELLMKDIESSMLSTADRILISITQMEQNENR